MVNSENIYIYSTDQGGKFNNYFILSAKNSHGRTIQLSWRVAKYSFFNITLPTMTSAETSSITLHCIKCHYALIIPGSSMTVLCGPSNHVQHTRNICSEIPSSFLYNRYCFHCDINEFYNTDSNKTVTLSICLCLDRRILVKKSI